MKHFGLKLFCLLAALVLWLQVAATTTVESTISLPLQAVGLREGFALAPGDLPAAVQVRVRGSRLLLIAHRYFGRHAGAVVVDLARPPVGGVVERDVSEDDVRSDFVALAVTPPVHLRLRTVSIGAAGGGEARR